jgi:hypothetical protein
VSPAADAAAQVYNQDDCVAINSGTNLYFSGLYCSGGHGLSIGSVGGRDDNTVKNVTFVNSQVLNSQNGVRIKTVYGATGSVSGVTYSGITLSGITNYGVVIEQDYENGSPTGTPTTGVPITGLTLKGITGTTTSGAKDNYYILCGSGACCAFAPLAFSVWKLTCPQPAGRSRACPSLARRAARATTSRVASRAEWERPPLKNLSLLCTIESLCKYKPFCCVAVRPGGWLTRFGHANKVCTLRAGDRDQVQQSNLPLCSAFLE